MSNPYSQVLERPVFIMAAPRSGSTLLFETLARAKSLFSIGDESHGLIEQFPGLRPERKPQPSNLLVASDVSANLREELNKAFLHALVDRNGARVISNDSVDSGQLIPRRMIEKTPKNILRIPFFNALYPDAQFIYLYRNPLQNISSIIDGWRSGHFVTYPGLQVAAGRWSFLLPPGWEKHKQAKLESMAAWQWTVSHQHAIEQLSKLDSNRIFCLNYDYFLQNSAESVKQLCLFMGIEYDTELAEHCERPLPLSRYTVSKPEPEKWKKNAALLAEVMLKTRQMVDKINQFVEGQSLPLELPWTVAELRKIAKKTNIKAKSDTASEKVSRNGPCPCGSGKKYKRCHGAISSLQNTL